MSVRVKVGNTMVSIVDAPSSLPKVISQYWDGTRGEVRIKQSKYEANEEFQQEMLDLFQQSIMTDYGRVRWALRMDRLDSGSYVVVLFLVPDSEKFR